MAYLKALSLTDIAQHQKMKWPANDELYQVKRLYSGVISGIIPEFV